VKKTKQSKFKTWKKITINNSGKHEKQNVQAGEIKKALKKKGIKISSWAKKILKRTEFKKNTLTVELVLVSGETLDFASKSSLVEIYRKATSRKLSLCPPELGFLLWQEDSELLACGEEVFIAMEAVEVSGTAGILVLAHDKEGKWLLATHGGPKTTWATQKKFLFVRS
jgi:hypothetical protein